MEQFHNGVLEDIRTPEEKNKDYKLTELYLATPVTWTSWNEWKNIPANKKLLGSIVIHDQNGSGSCVSQACAYVIAINNYLEEGKYKHFSSRWIYPRRRNKPAEGMYFDDAAKLLTEFGGIEEVLVPSDHKAEAEMNRLDDILLSYETIGKIYAPKNYIWLDLTMDSFVQTLSQGRPVLMGVRFGDNEWGIDVPVIKSEIKYGHGIVALGFFYYEGKRSMLIVDSWGVTNPMKGFRILTEDWFTHDRIIAGIQFVDLQNRTFDNQTQLPHYTFNRDLYYGLVNDPDVKKLQEVLCLMGFFPNNDLFTGNYYGLTMKAVTDFQLAHNVILDKTEAGAGRFGPKTRNVMNNILKNG